MYAGIRLQGIMPEQNMGCMHNHLSSLYQRGGGFRRRTLATSHPPPRCFFHRQPYHSSRGPMRLTRDIKTVKTMPEVDVSVAKRGSDVDSSGEKRDMARKTVDTVSIVEKRRPASWALAHTNPHNPGSLALAWRAGASLRRALQPEGQARKRAMLTAIEKQARPMQITQRSMTTKKSGCV